MNPQIFNNLESSINTYDNTGFFSIGFKMFLFGFALVFLVLFYSNFEYNNESSPLNLASNAEQTLFSMGVIVAILGLITSIVSTHREIT